jgi:hemerythrin-like domain-containing protein/pimeloyl-ACP methyl ester carboxylesterase
MVLGLAARPLLRKASIPDGDGRPVMLLPGFGANEALLKRLKAYLEHCGYVVEIFIPGFPKNQSLHDFIDEISEPISRRIAELAKQTGKPVSLVGQSAGGLYSREYVLRRTENVDRVISLGSPTFCPENLHLQNKALSMLIERGFGTKTDQAFSGDARFLHWDKQSPQIPYVAIYSPIDGAVRAETVVIPGSQLSQAANGAIRENIAILASHFGMVQNPLVMLAIADRLGADTDDWQAFDPADYIPGSMQRISAVAFPPVDLDKYDIPVTDLHPHQPRGRDARERVVSTLRTEHHNIGKLLDTVLEEIDGHSDDHELVPNYAVIVGIVDYLGNYTDGFHHPREDLMFERLVKHKPELTAPIEKLMDEHQAIETEVRALEAHLLQHLGGRRADSRNKSLDAHCRRYVKKLQAHLAFEETEVFPHTDVMQRRDWAAVDKGLAHEPDPLFGAEVQERYEELADALAGRVEGISESMAYSDVLSLGAVASGVEVLGAGLASMRDQQIEQAKAVGRTQKRVIGEAFEKRSLLALAALPLSLTKANVALAKENTVASYESAKHVVRDVRESWRNSRQAP